jgi:hypothetical protein
MKSSFTPSVCVISKKILFCILCAGISINIVVDVSPAIASPQSFCKKIRMARTKTVFGTFEYEQINNLYEENECGKVLYGEANQRYTDYLRGEQQKIDSRNQYLNEDMNCSIYGFGSYNPSTRQCNETYEQMNR